MKKLLISLSLLAALVGQLAAQTAPYLADVTGVAADDTLNIRENPRASASRIGSLDPDATGIEVVDLSDSLDWARINFGEQSGWVSARYLAARAPALPEGTLFDNGLHCFGTEPFWTLTVPREQDVTVFERIDAPARRLARLYTGTSSNIGKAGEALLMEDAMGRVTATLRRGQCDNGMSDNLYALQFDMVVEGADQPVLLSGCCTLQTD